MTTFRSNTIAEDDIELQYVSSEDPDTIGIEINCKGDTLFVVDMYPDGSLTIMFDEAENAEFNLSTFRGLIDRCERELKTWRDNLVSPGSIWEKQ